MNWLSGNLFFIVLLLVCVGVHMFHGHGNHKQHGNDKGSEDINKQHKHE